MDPEIWKEWERRLEGGQKQESRKIVYEDAEGQRTEIRVKEEEMDEAAIYRVTGREPRPPAAPSGVGFWLS